MTILWNDVAIVSPSVADKNYVVIGGTFTATSGAQVFDIQATKHLITLHWDALTTAEKDTIVALAIQYIPMLIDLRNVGYGAVNNVISQPNTLKASPWGVIPLWSVDVQVREV